MNNSSANRRRGANIRCCYGICKSDSRSKSYLEGTYYFIRFPKPCTKYRNKLIDPSKKLTHVKNCAECSKCKSWVKLCRRGDKWFQCIDDVKKDTHICSLHFHGRSGPTEAFPDIKSDSEDGDGPQAKKAKTRTNLETKYQKSKLTKEQKSETVSENNEREFGLDNLPINGNQNIQGFRNDILSADAELWNNCGEYAGNNNEEKTNERKMCNTGTQTEPMTCSIGTQTEANNSTTSTQMDRVVTKNCKTQTSFHFKISIDRFVESIQKDDKKCFFYTGLKFFQIVALLNFVSPECENLSYRRRSTDNVNKNVSKKMKITCMQQLLLVLVRLRAGLLLQDMAYRFDVSLSFLSKNFHIWIHFLYNEFSKNLRPLMFPSRQIVLQTLPQIFKSAKNIRALFDCTEFFCQSPKSFEHQGNLYSSYKAHTTFKVFIACTPNGAICFVSDVFEGSISDREIFIKSKFVDFLEPGDLVIGDRGFLVHDIVQTKRAHLNIPPFLNGRDRLSQQEEIETKKIAKQRIYIEHAIGRIKQFRLLNRIIPLKVRGIINQIVFVTACLVNCQEPIVFDQ